MNIIRKMWRFWDPSISMEWLRIATSYSGLASFCRLMENVFFFTRKTVLTKIVLAEKNSFCHPNLSSCCINLTLHFLLFRYDVNSFTYFLKKSTLWQQWSPWCWYWWMKLRTDSVTCPRFARAASAFCLVSSKKWSVLFSMFDLSPLHHGLNWQLFNIDLGNIYLFKFMIKIKKILPECSRCRRITPCEKFTPTYTWKLYEEIRRFWDPLNIFGPTLEF